MNKNIFHTILAFMAVAMICSSCVLHISKHERSSDNKIKKTYDVTAFKGIDAQSGVEIIYTVSDTVSVKAEGNEDELKYLQITVGEDSIMHITRSDSDTADEKADGKRWINLTPNSSGNRQTIWLYISGPAVSSLEIHGAAEFTCESVIKVPSMTIDIHGAGDVGIEGIETGDFKTDTHGASNLEIYSLKAQTATIETSGTSNHEIKFFGVKSIEATSSGASNSNFEFTDCGNASIHLSGAGAAELSGTLHHLDKNVSGMGTIDDDDLTIK